MKTYLIIFLFLFNATSFCQKAEVGQIAPDFEISQTFGQDLKAKKLSDLKGKFVILDFWATWCKPCIKTMPYIERIKEQFGDTLLVMAISDETSDEIKLFLNKKTTNVSYLVDNQSTITSKYKVSAIPHSVLIGADGLIKAIGSPLSFTPAIIRKVMENQVVEIVKTVVSLDNDPILDKISKGVQFEFDVTPYNQNQASFIRDVSKGEYANRRLYFSNMTIKAIYEYLYQMPNRGVLKIKNLEKFTNSNEASNLYCVDIIVRPEEATKRFQIGIEQMHKHFSMQSQIEYMTLMAKVLRIQSKDMLPKIAPYNAIESQAMSFDNLAATISSFNTFGMPVVDATNRQERFLISFEKLPDEPYQLINALQNYGLSITEEIQKIPTLILFERN